MAARKCAVSRVLCSFKTISLDPLILFYLFSMIILCGADHLDCKCVLRLETVTAGGCSIEEAMYSQCHLLRKLAFGTSRSSNIIRLGDMMNLLRPPRDVPIGPVESEFIEKVNKCLPREPKVMNVTRNAMDEHLAEMETAIRQANALLEKAMSNEPKDDIPYRTPPDMLYFKSAHTILLEQLCTLRAFIAKSTNIRDRTEQYSDSGIGNQQLLNPDCEWTCFAHKTRCHDQKVLLVQGLGKLIQRLHENFNILKEIWGCYEISQA